LGPSLVLVTYFLTRELTSNETTSLFAAFLTAATSYHLLGGIFAGFYANWLALIVGYLSFVFLFRYLRRSGKANLIIFAALILLTLLSHVYTWSILALVIGIFLGVSIILKQDSRKRAVLLLLVLLSTVIIDVARTMITGSSGGMERDLKLSQGQLFGIEQFASRWDNLILTTQLYYGSMFSNFIIVALALYWLVRSNLAADYNLLIAIFFSIGILPFFFGDWIIQSRVLYDIPFQIPAAIALTYISRWPIYSTKGLAISVTICTWLVAMSARTLSNFYLVKPN
jgi:hypothetical protein